MSIFTVILAIVTVHTAQLDSLYNDAQVVTNVTATSDLPPDYTTTNAVREIVAPMTNAAVAAAVGCATNAAKAYADGTFLPKANPDKQSSTIEWSVFGESDSWLSLSGIFKADKIVANCIIMEFDAGALRFTNETTPYQDSSELTPDNTPVLTANLATNTFPIVTNVYTKGEVTSLLGDKVSFVSSGIQISRDDGDCISKSGGGGYYVSQSGSGSTFIPVGRGDVVVSDDISASNATFSNAVINVTMNVSSNEVAAIRAMVGDIGDLPIEGGAATIGGLLMALAAAVAWLKKKKIEKLKCSGVSDITTENGEVDVSSLFSGANTSLVAVCQQYGGTQIKRDEQGNYYYDVED